MKSYIIKFMNGNFVLSYKIDALNESEAMDKWGEENMFHYEQVIDIKEENNDEFYIALKEDILALD